MAFIRQRVAGILLLVGLLCSWVGLTSVVLRQTILIPGQFTSYAYKALGNAAVRSEVAGIIATDVENSHPILQSIPKPKLASAIDSALTKPSVKAEFANVALQIQQHILGLQNGPIQVGGPTLSTAIAQIIAPGNSPEEQALAQIPFGFQISGSSIPSLKSYYQKLNAIIKISLVAAAATLLSALMISAKKSKTLRKIGIAFIGFSAFEVLLFWAVPKYFLPHIKNGPLEVIAAIVNASSSSVDPIYLTAFGAGIGLSLISFLI